MGKINIAIDGHSSCGKSTMARQLATELGYIYVDTGAMYRAITLFLLENDTIGEHGIDRGEVIAHLPNIHVSFNYNSELSISETFLNGRNVEREIRSMQVSSYVSKISIIKEVRQKLVNIQQEIGTEKGVVMEGRDIGTVVFPNAELKIFLTADIEIRVKRRYDELQLSGVEVTKEQVKENIANRDHEDTSRDENPLVQAADAVVINNSNLSLGEQLAKAVALANGRIGAD